MAQNKKQTAARNACKSCAPLGASIAFKGVENSMPLLHGSQGCATYIRRYCISHFREPLDIASSSFSEDSAIFGGNENLARSMDNVIMQYRPGVLGVATTCLSETIGEDTGMGIFSYKNRRKGEYLPEIILVSSPAYRGTHINGFHDAIRALADKLARGGERGDHINLFPPMLSPADIRYLKEILHDYGIDAVILPDYSETLDGPMWSEYQKIPEGGTKLSGIQKMGRAAASIRFGSAMEDGNSAGKLLWDRFGVPCWNMAIPIGINATDKFFESLCSLSGRRMPEKYTGERGRLIDSYADGHKYVFGLKALVYGDEDMVVSTAAFLDEIGVIPAICASGGKSGFMAKKLEEAIPGFGRHNAKVMEGADFIGIGEASEVAKPDIMIGSSKGFALSKKMDIPLVRTGFPIHDRFGGQRVLHTGYRGAQHLFDRLVNSVIARRQRSSPVGYSYM